MQVRGRTLWSGVAPVQSSETLRSCDHPRSAIVHSDALQPASLVVQDPDCVQRRLGWNVALEAPEKSKNMTLTASPGVTGTRGRGRWQCDVFPASSHRWRCLWFSVVATHLCRLLICHTCTTLATSVTPVPGWQSGQLVRLLTVSAWLSECCSSLSHLGKSSFL